MVRNPNRPVHKPVFYCPKCDGQREHKTVETHREIRYRPGLGNVPHGVDRRYYCEECNRLNYILGPKGKRKAVF